MSAAVALPSSRRAFISGLRSLQVGPVRRVRQEAGPGSPLTAERLPYSVLTTSISVACHLEGGRHGSGPAAARVVVIGAGIVGNSLVYHLARLGWRDIVQIDKGALPNPGGSTGHASNFIFPVDHSREITDLTLDCVRQYQEMGVFTESGGFEVARTEERMEELRRRMSSAPRPGASRPSWSRPEQVAEKVPFLDPTSIVGAFWTPVGRRRRLPARRHDHARAGPGARRADRRTQRRGRRARRRGRADPPGAHRPAATSRPRPSSSPAACGARRSPRMAGATSR